MFGNATSSKYLFLAKWFPESRGLQHFAKQKETNKMVHALCEMVLSEMILCDMVLYERVLCEMVLCEMQKSKKNKWIIQCIHRNTFVFVVPELTYMRCSTWLTHKGCKPVFFFSTTGPWHENNNWNILSVWHQINELFLQLK